jgi:chromatin structure-remodeling complex subunit RSC9
MSLSLRSGIHTEIAWALDRLCRLCHNDQFLLKSIPGLIDGLFEWPEWYITEGYKESTDKDSLFSLPPDRTRQRRFALESLFVIRNTALNEQNAWELSNHSHTMPLVLNALHDLPFNKEENTEFILHIIDLYHVIASKLVITPSTPLRSNPLPPLQRFALQSSNRTLIIASLTALTLTLSNPSNAVNISPDSPALGASIRYLPLFVDKPLIDACLNYFYMHISHMSMAKAFLLLPEMPAVLRLLVSFLLKEQQLLEEKVTLDITGSVRTVSSNALSTRDHELTKDELDTLLSKSEPQRCYDWYAF